MHPIPLSSEYDYMRALGLRPQAYLFVLWAASLIAALCVTEMMSHNIYLS